MSKLAQLAIAVPRYALPKFRTFLKYAAVELKPPSPGDMPEISKGFSNLARSMKTGKWKQLTIKEAWLNTLVGLEIAMWFFAGEVIGKRHLKGYYVAPS